MGFWTSLCIGNGLDHISHLLILVSKRITLCTGVTVWSAAIKASRGLEEGLGVLVMSDQVALNV